MTYIMKKSQLIFIVVVGILLSCWFQFVYISKFISSVSLFSQNFFIKNNNNINNNNVNLSQSEEALNSDVNVYKNNQNQKAENTESETIIEPKKNGKQNMILAISTNMRPCWTFGFVRS